jgi:hypothetical protein
LPAALGFVARNPPLALAEHLPRKNLVPET